MYSRRFILFLFIILASFTFPVLSQSVEILKPDGSEQLKFGEAMKVSWLNTGLGANDYFQLFYSKDGAAYVNFDNAYYSQTLKSGDTTYRNWTIPDFGTNLESTVKVIVKNYTQNLSDTSAAFRVYFEPKVAITIPTGTEQLKFGQTIKVSWLNGDLGANDYYQLFYSKDGAAFVNFDNAYYSQTLKSGDTTYRNWTIPDFGTDPESTVRIMINNYSRNVSDTSEAFRVYFEPKVNITVPSGTEQLKFGQTIKVSWLNGDLGANDYYQLFYSKDGAAFVNFDNAYYSQTLKSGDTTSRNWTIPDFGTDPESTVRILVNNYSRNVADTSEAFRVYFEPKVNITIPSGTEQLKFGKTVKVSWLNGDLGSNDYYQLFYSKDGAAFVNFDNAYYSQTIKSGDTTSRNWTIPDFGTDPESTVRILVNNYSRNVADTSAEFRIYFEPSVKIVNPDSLSAVKFGDKMKVSWFNGDLGSNDYYQLFYSKDGAAYVNFYNGYYSQVGKSGDTTYYNWTIPDFGTDADSEVKVVVNNYTRNVADTSDAFRVYFEPEVNITVPDSLVALKFGERLKLSWLNGDLGNNDYYQLYYSKDGAAYVNFYNGYYSQVGKSSDTTYYNWTIPDFGTDDDSQVKVVVNNISRNVADTSQAFRVYFEPSVTIKSFYPGEYVLQGTVKRVSWLNGDLGSNDYYQLYYSTDGTTYNNFYNGYYSQQTKNGDEIYRNWTVPNVATSTAKVVVYNNSRNVSDTTEIFTICTTCPAVALYTPNGGEILGIGRQVEIGWSVGTSWVATDSVYLEYSTDGGATFAAPFYKGLYSGFTDNKYLWSVNSPETTQGRVRISNITQAASDISDNNFTVVAPPEAPSGFTVQENANQTVTLTWLDNATNETVYRVEYSANNINWNNFSGNLSANSTSYTTPFLGENAYWWRVKVYSQYFESVSDTLYAGGYSPFGRSLAFVSGDLVTLPTNASLEFGTGDFTLETWVKPNLASSGILNNSTGFTPDHFGFYISNGLLYGRVSDSFNPLTSTTQLTAGTWHHIAMVRSAGALTLYVDGIQEATATGASAFNVTAAAIRLGAYKTTTLNGELDEVRFWNVSRTGADILSKKDTVLLGNETGLVAYYRMDQKVGTTVIDKSSNKLDGTWTSSSTASPAWVVSEVGVDKTPVITLTKPNGGEKLIAGQAYNVTWTTSNIPDTDLIEIRLSTDGGSTYSILNDGTFGMYAGSYNWTVSGTVNDLSRIKIVNTTQNVADSSDANFSIVPVLPAITVTYPNGGEVFTAGKAYTFRWVSANIPDSDLIEIRLSTDGGQSYAILNDGTFGTFAGSYSWIPVQGTSQARIQIANITQNVADESDANFTIDSAEPLINITSPNGGETLTIGESYAIKWSTLNIPSTDLIEIKLSTDGGSTYAIIGDGTFGSFTGSYSWTVAGSVTQMASLVVTNTTQNVSDTTDADFYIQAAPQVITVTNPNTLTSFNAGQKVGITWTTSNVPPTDSVDVQLTIDGGTTYQSIAKGTFESLNGSVSWTVPDITSFNCYIKVTNITSSKSDISNSNFYIRESPKVTLTAPNGGEQWETGTFHYITWNPISFGNSDIMNVGVSYDGGANWSLLVSGTSANNLPSNRAPWTVPDQVSKNVLIYVHNQTLNVSDTSDAPFEIYKVNRSVSLITPNGGELFTQGEQITVKFAVEGLLATDILNFNLSLDDGKTFPYNIAQGYVSAYPDSSFTWTVSQFVTATARLQLKVTNYNVADTTDASFEIQLPPSAPVFLQRTTTLIGDNYTTVYSLNEAGKLYVLALPDGQVIPTATAVKAAALGDSTFENQAASGNFDYTTAEEVVTVSGSGAFVRQQYYDFYLATEDLEGNLSFTYQSPNVLAQFTPLEKDSIVVNTIYTLMGGENWTNIAEGWIDLPLSERQEIKVENERITEINLSGKSLVGNLPQGVTSLDSLTAFDISTNQIDFIPDLSNLSKLAILRVGDNKLDFGDLQPNSNLFTQVDQYSPQANFGAEDSLALAKGSNYIFNGAIGGESNTYIWYLDNYNTYPVSFAPIANATQSTYQIQNIDFNNMGTYYVEVSNEQLPGLTISSERKQIWATADLEINVVANGKPVPTAAAYALRNQGPRLPYDSIPKTEDGLSNPDGLVFTNGKAVFHDLLLGSYLVAIRGDKALYLPTYYSNTYLWEEADILDFKDNLTQTMRMFVVPRPLTPADGSGLVSGFIESDFGGGLERIDARKKVKRAGCSMRKFVATGRANQEGEWELVAYVESDDDGKFKFEYIPAGTYRFNIEYPGIPMDPDSYVEFTVGEDGSANSTIELSAVITEEGIVVDRTNTLGFTREQLAALSVYPNPVADQLHIDIESIHRGLMMRMVDMSGHIIWSKSLFSQEKLDIDVSTLNAGVYFVQVTDPADAAKLISYKVMIKH